MKFNDVILLFGGNSEERLVSVASAQNLARQLEFEALWFLTPQGSVHAVTQAELLAHKNPFTTSFATTAPVLATTLEKSVGYLAGKAILIALHGTEGEDGTLQRLLETHHIPFTGSDSKASQLAFDKIATKRLAGKHGLPLVEDLALQTSQPDFVSQAKAFCQRHKNGVVFKPIANGSSVGLTIALTSEQMEDAINKLARLPTAHYMLEPFINGREITVGVYDTGTGQLALPPSEVVVERGRNFDYEGKYLGSGVRELTPAPITNEQTLACQKVALEIHRQVGCFGYSRTDMILTEDGPYLLEINTLPGLSGASFIPQQLHAANITLADFFKSQIELARKRRS